MQRLNDTRQASTDGDGTRTTNRQVRRQGERREKENDGRPVPNVNSVSPRKEFPSQATDCPPKEPCLLCLTITARKTNHVFFENSGHFKVFYFYTKSQHQGLI